MGSSICRYLVAPKMELETPCRTMKCPPPPLQPIRAPTTRPFLSSLLMVSQDAALDCMLTKLLVRVKALSKYHGTLHAPGTGVVQHCRLNSLLATLHCVHGLKNE